MEIMEILSGITDTRRDAVLRIYAGVEEEFKTKPSSTKFHHIEVGGMGRHVKEVMNIALTTYDTNPGWYQATRDSVAIVAFVHDFNKLGKYKDLPPGDWRRQPKYGAQLFEYSGTGVYIDETAEAVFLCHLGGLSLTREEINAITFHHGFISDSAKDNKAAMQQMTPLSVLLHFADVMSVKVYD